MTEPTQRYMRSSFPVLVFCGTNKVTQHFIRDASSWEEFDDSFIESYVVEGTEMLKKSLEEFTNPSEPFNSLRAKELRFMLEALIEVKELFTGIELPILCREG